MQYEKLDLNTLSPAWQEYISLCKPNEELEDNGLSEQFYNAWCKWCEDNGIKGEDISKDRMATFTCEELK